MTVVWSSLWNFATATIFQQQPLCIYLYTGINILSIEELLVINTFVNSLGDKEKANAYCGLSEDEIKIKFKNKPSINTELFFTIAASLSVYHEYNGNINKFICKLGLLITVCIAEMKATSAKMIRELQINKLNEKYINIRCV